MNDTGKASLWRLREKKKKKRHNLISLDGEKAEQIPWVWLKHGVTDWQWMDGLGQPLRKDSTSSLNHNLVSLYAAADFWSKLQTCTELNKQSTACACVFIRKKKKITTCWLLGSLAFHNITKGFERWTATASLPWKPISSPVGNAKITGNCD